MAKMRILLLLALSFVCGCAMNPVTGEEELMLLPTSQDIALGQKYAPAIEKELGGKINSPELQSYINNIGQKLAAVSHNTDFSFTFAALEDKQINAFALPGGHIYITRGMLEKLNNESQLAGILSHEIVHVVARDTAAVMSREIGIDILMSAAVQSGSSRGAVTVADLARTITGLKYSRDDERTADLAGLDYMVAAGYNPYGMVETMQILQREEKSRPVEFLSTHPSPENRVEYITEKIQGKYFNLASLKIGVEDYQVNVLSRLKR